MRINGVIVPSITFFNKSFEINREINSLLYRHIILNGANAIFIFGVTGEGPFFSNKIQEKISLINIALEVAHGKVPVLIGIFGNQIDEVIDEMEILGRKFKDIYFVISPPFQSRISKNDLVSYFENIIASSKLENPILLYNNPNLFNGNDLEPEILKKLIKFPKLKGIKDSSDKINNYKANISYLSEYFGVYCGKEGKFSTFLQLIPLEKRKFSGLVPSIGNVSDICSKLYSAALEDNLLKLHKLQDELEDFRNKIYDIKEGMGKQARGLKHAFLYLYKDIISKPIEEVNVLSPNFQRDMDDTTKSRIEEIVNYLVKNDLIQQLYSLKNQEIHQIGDIRETFSDIEILNKQGRVKKIIGPFNGKINVIYRVNFDRSQLIFRFRASKSFKYENIAKEKVLFPFLDGSLSINTPNLKEKIKEILKSKKGSYIFKKKNPPIIPVGSLIYYDETKERLPYIFTIQEYIPGQPLHHILEKFNSNNFAIYKQKYLNCFQLLGETLGKLHQIKFDSFYESIMNIGQKRNTSWLNILSLELNSEIQESKKNKFEYVNEYRAYFKDNISLIDEEDEAILFHNDFQSQNVIVKEKANRIKVSGLIDFDNWKIGVRPQDFVKMEFWTLKPLNEPALNKIFYQGYKKYYEGKINKDFMKKIEIYSLLWFLKVYNFEMDKIRKDEQKESVDKRFPAVEIYLEEIKRILRS